MKLWLSKNNEIPLREQIIRQIMLAITCGDLLAGQKLPSVREIALRYDVHPNTVGASYRWLEENGWVTARRGSGVFVRDASERNNFKLDAESELDRLISDFLNTARTHGFSPKQIAERLEKRFPQTKFERIVVIEKDAELQRILATEIQAAVNLPVFETKPEKIYEPQFWLQAITVSLDENQANRILPQGASLVRLQLNSAQNEMRGKQRPDENELVGVVSGWEKFLSWTRTMLIAAGIEAEQIVLRDACLKDWDKCLETCAFVIADSLIAQKLPPTLDVRVFRLVSETSLAEVKSLID